MPDDTDQRTLGTDENEMTSSKGCSDTVIADRLVGDRRRYKDLAGRA